MSADDRVAQEMATYNAIAQPCHLTATQCLPAWKDASMRRFVGHLPGNAVLAPERDDGRDSHHLATLGLSVTSSIYPTAAGDSLVPGSGPQRPTSGSPRSRAPGPDAGRDLEERLPVSPDQAGIRLLRRRLRSAAGAKRVLYLTTKEGDCEHCEDEPGARHPGVAEPQMRLRGKPSEGRFELWLRRS
jgi:hypothetical protein